MSTRVHGMAVPYNVPNSHNEIIRPGAFSGFLDELRSKDKALSPDGKLAHGWHMPMYWNHEEDQFIGSWDTIIDGSDGLYVAGEIKKEWLFRKKRFFSKKPMAMSITFQVLVDSPEKNFHMMLRKAGLRSKTPMIVEKASFTEVSLTTSPAFREAILHIDSE